MGLPPTASEETVYSTNLLRNGGNFMTDSEKLDLLISDMQSMQSDIQNMPCEMRGMKSEVQDMNMRIKSLELHVENGTDKNIQLIAENFIELTKKLNQAIPAADKNLAYEVKVNYLIEKFQLLEQRVTKLEEQTA